MSIDQLIATMEARGAAEAAGVLEAAREEAVTIARQARMRMHARRQERERVTEQECRAYAAAEMADARRTTRADVLRARAASVERVWDSTRARLSGKAVRERLRSVVASHVREALPYLEDREAIVYCAVDLVKDVRAALKREAVAVPVEADSTVGTGVVIASKDGTVLIDNTLDARMTRLQPRLATELATQLTSTAMSGGQGSSA
jgi:vacuolar-type H+-ATPase subunit E/Vma4